MSPCVLVASVAVVVGDVKALHVGCSGWNYREWRGGLYPPELPSRRWLECYARRFDTVEVNSTFYRLASREAVEHWREQVPRDFLFAVKASRYLTHVKRLADPGASIARFFDPLEPLRDAGQARACPVAAARVLPPRRAAPAEAARAAPGGTARVRVPPSELVRTAGARAARRHRAALVIGDHPERPFQSLDATTPWRYVRFHYGSRGRRGNYSQRELEQWARRLHGWRATHELFVYFNNDWEGFAPRNALWLGGRLEELRAGTARRANGSSSPRRR